jgi:hypothetical protein
MQATYPRQTIPVGLPCPLKPPLQSIGVQTANMAGLYTTGDWRNIHKMQEKNEAKEKMLTLGKSRSIGPGSGQKLDIAPEIGEQGEQYVFSPAGYSPSLMYGKLYMRARNRQTNLSWLQ